MQKHTLKRSNKSRRAVRIGRGGKRGSYSGRGTKGQKARAGRRIRPEIRDLIMKMPKRRGHRRTGPPNRMVAISASIIARKFRLDEKVTPKTLVAKRLVRRLYGRIPKVKILGPFGALSKHTVSGVEFSRKQPE